MAPGVPNTRRAAGLTRQRALRVPRRDEDLRPHIRALKTAPPCWGSRRLWAYRSFVERLPVTKTRLLRVMREQTLLVRPNRPRTAQRPPSRQQPQADDTPRVGGHRQDHSEGRGLWRGL